MLFQIFSKSVADGIQFYKHKGLPGLEGADACISVTKKLNDLFDACNKKTFGDGIKQGGKDFEVR